MLHWLNERKNKGKRMKAIDKCTLPEVYFTPLSCEPIEVTDANRKYIQEHFQKKNDKTWNELAIELITIRRELRELAQREAEIKEALVSMSGHANSTGGGIQVEKIVKRGSIQYSRIEMLKQVDLEQYRSEPTEYWKVSEL
jgi:hypothetical protein